MKPLGIWISFSTCVIDVLNHRGLKLDGAIGQGEIWNSLILEKIK